MTESNAPRSVVARAAEVTATGTVLSATCLALNGFPRFDVPQLGVATFFAAALLVVWTAALFRGHVQLRERALAPLLAWTLLLAWATGSAALQSHGGAWDTVAYLVLPTPFLALAVGPIAGARTRTSVLAALGAALALSATASVAQALGMTFPDDIPAITFSGMQSHALFDAPMTAAAWFAGAGTVAAILSAAPNATRPVLIALAGLAGAGLGLADTPLAFAIAGAGLLGVLIGGDVAARLQRSAPAWAALLIAGAIGMMLVPTPGEHGWLSELDDPVPDQVRTGQPVDWSDPEARSAWTAAALAAVPTAQPFGAGAGDFASPALEALDTDSPYALATLHGQPEPRTAPSALLTWTVELGVLIPIMLLLAFGLLGLRRRDTAGPAFALTGLALLSITGGTSAGLAALAGVCALLTSEDTEPASATSKGPAPLMALALAALCMVAVATQARAMAWGHHHAFAINLIANGQHMRSYEELQAAAAAQERYETLTTLAMLAHYVATDADFETTVAEPLQRAVEIHSSAPIPRFVLADAFIREAAAGTEEVPARTEITVRLLQTVNEVDPNLIQAWTSSSDLHLSMGEEEESVELLLTAAERPVAPEVRAEVYGLIGERYADFIRNPDEALAAYQQAAELATTPSRRDAFSAEVLEMAQWVESGVRPSDHDHDHDHDHGDHDHGDHEGHDHGDHEGHDHGDHEGHDHEEHDHGDHDHGGHEGHDHGDHE